MKVKASTIKSRSKTNSPVVTSAPVSKENFTITARIKRPDIVRQVAEERGATASASPNAKTANFKRNTRPLGNTTKTRQKAYFPGGRKKNVTVYWALGGLGAFTLIMLCAIIIAVSSRPSNHPSTISNTTTPTHKTKAKPNVRYGPGSWADDPETRAAIESSQMYQNRQSMRKNIKKDY